MSPAQERRRILLVDRKNQLKYVGIIIATILAVNFVIGFCVYFSLWGNLTSEYSKIVIAQKIALAERIQSYQSVRTGQPSESVNKIDEEADLLSDHLLGQLKQALRKTQMKLLPILLLLLLVVVFEGIAISNRVAGPIYHVEKSLAKLEAGDLTNRTYFRKKDEFQGLHEKLNLVSQELHYRISTLKRQLGKIADTAEDLKQSLGRYNPEMETQVSAQAEQILKRVVDCNNVLAKFTVAPENPADNNKEA